MAALLPGTNITLTSGTTTDQVSITQRNFDEPHKTLGVFMSPTEDDSAQKDVALRTDSSSPC